MYLIRTTRIKFIKFVFVIKMVLLLLKYKRGVFCGYTIYLVGSFVKYFKEKSVNSATILVQFYSV